MLAPICIFTYNRFNEIEQTFKALKKNYLAGKSDLIIFSDGPKNEKDKLKVDRVRQFIDNINDGFKSIKVIKSPMNKGLADSVISGVSMTIKKYGKVIVLEDDLITAPNFLNFMNQALDFYGEQKKIFSISGYTLDLPSLKFCDKDYYLGYRASSWGWGTWQDRWENVDWSAKGWLKTLLNPVLHYSFKRGGADMPYMLWKQMNNKIDSWAIRWCYEQYKSDTYTIFPVKSKVRSIGFGMEATHTRHTKRFFNSLDIGTKISFDFYLDFEIDKKLAKEQKRSFSIIRRLEDRI